MSGQAIDLVFGIAILIMSVVIHEVSHGYVANILGDPTARHAGRLTLNPISHIDPIGSVLVPLVTFFTAGAIFGWAKPVPYNPYNLRNGRWGPALVAFAGPGSNLVIAVVFSILAHVSLASGVIPPTALGLMASIVYINLLLCVVNLVPIPPIDGSKILFALLPYQWRGVETFLTRYSLFIILFLILFGWQFLSPVIDTIIKFAFNILI